MNTRYEAASAMQRDIGQCITDAIAVKQAVLKDRALHEQIEQLAHACIGALKAGGKIIFAGNGGSFADAQHLSAEFTSRFLMERAPLASLALGTNNSALSAIGNDYGYTQVFARELQSIGKPEDVFVPISTSGNSANVLAAVAAARTIGMTIMGWSGSDGGTLSQCCDCIRVPSTQTAHIQECHIMIGHILCGLVETELFCNRLEDVVAQ